MPSGTRPATSSRSGPPAATDRGAAARAAALDAASRLRPRRALPPGVRRARRASGRPRSPTWRSFRSRPRPTCGRTTRSACSRCRAEQVVRVHASSGTTGKPTVVGYTKGDVERWAEPGRALDPRRRRPPWRHRSTSPTATASSPAAGRALRCRAHGLHGGADVGGNQTEKQVQLIADFRPDIIMVTPSYIRVSIEEMRRQGWTRAGLAQGRHLRRRAVDRGDAPRHRARLDRAVDIYGLSEVMGPAWPASASSKDGPVVWEDHFPGDHRPGHRRGAARRRRGRTRLHHADQGGAAHRALPHARPDAPAAADGAHRSGASGKIVGRSDDMLIIRGVNVFPTQIEELVLQHAALSGSTRSSSAATACSDEVEVRCELGVAGEGAPAEIAAWLRGASSDPGRHHAPRSRCCRPTPSSAPSSARRGG